MKYLFNRLVVFLAFVFSCLILMLGLFNNVYKPSAFQWINYQHIYIISIISAILLVVACTRLKLLNKHIRHFTYIYVFIIGLIFIFGFDWNQVSDPKTMIDSMEVLLQNGVSSFVEQYDYYYQMFPYQFIYSLLIYICISINQSYGLEILKLIQLMVYIVSISYAFKLVSLITEKEIYANVLAVLLVTWITPIIFTTYIYGTSLGMSIALISIYYFVLFYKTNSIKAYGCSLMLLLVSMMMKLNFSIVLVAYLIFNIFSKLNLKVKLLSCIGLICVYICSSLINGLLYELIIGVSIGKGIPILAYFVMGGLPLPYFPTSVSAIPGEWNGYTIGLAEFSKMDVNVMSSSSLHNFIEQIGFTFAHLEDAFTFYYYKLVNTWAVKDFATIDMLQSWYQSENSYSLLALFNNKIITNGYICFSAISYFLIFIGLLVLCFIRLKHYVVDSVLLFLLIFVGFFVYHFISESKAIYIVPVIYMMLPVITLGLGELSFILNKSLLQYRSKTIGICFAFISIALVFNTTRIAHYWYSDNTSGQYGTVELKPNDTLITSFELHNDTMVDSIQIFFSNVTESNTNIELAIYINSDLVDINNYSILNNELIVNIDKEIDSNDILSIEIRNIDSSSMFFSTSDQQGLIQSNNVNLYIRYIMITNEIGNQWYGNDYYQLIPTY